MGQEKLVAEVGSTTTVVSMYNEKGKLVAQGQSSTTVEAGDVLLGLNRAQEDLKQQLDQNGSFSGSLDDLEMYATSSAAGGLKMTVHGLVYDMTARASREAALGAGAVIHQVTAGELSQEDIDNTLEISPNIILLAGGVDYGEEKTVVNNARYIADSGIKAPIVYAGNVACQEKVVKILESAGLYVKAVENVYPTVDELNVEPARKAIQQIFQSHIVHAPGMEKIKERVNGSIMPTPGAVMEGAKRVADKIGDAMVIDVGGATTDVHSVTDGSQEMLDLTVAPEPRAKRTVEGDLGVYRNAKNLIDLMDESYFESGMSQEDMLNIIADWEPFPQNESEKHLLQLFAKIATFTAVDRHAGAIKYLYGPTGRQKIVKGKDLTKIRYVIGTGGALGRSKPGEKVIKELLKRYQPSKLTPPKDAQLILDSNYSLAAIGLLSVQAPEMADRIIENFAEHKAL
ncbi:GlmL-related ornithine degradation protein [Natranaerobius thermophilus]|uniref:Putative component of D-ornithine aminomutase n=1 Tax=Natranaerobius thermophilus (strain ATCC BAA-1301 / DSM 18059 / JW/NM-WN-LF) TaxID=457570 RepID=B2A1L4_NATTJ|nr:GlmL-related ornithine degradation protein [Natranaerobius thermophilus]ACB84754.1 putative component of D-ornithine aminomutase [Natranaerobius thermophilus JW/NM-WN-LF]